METKHRTAITHHIDISTEGAGLRVIYVRYSEANGGTLRVVTYAPMLGDVRATALALEKCLVAGLPIEEVLTN